MVILQPFSSGHAINMKPIAVFEILKIRASSKMATEYIYVSSISAYIRLASATPVVMAGESLEIYRFKSIN